MCISVYNLKIINVQIRNEYLLLNERILNSNTQTVRGSQNIIYAV